MIQQKLFNIMGKLKVEKDGTNLHFKSKYVTLDSILTTLLPLLEEQKLVVYNGIKGRSLITEVFDLDSKQNLTSEFPIAQDDPQKIGSCITYAKRYNLGALFNIITEFDDDGNSVSGDNHKPSNAKGLNIDDYIDSIRMETDTSHIETLFKECVATLKLTANQLDYLKWAARKRTDYLTADKGQNHLPSTFKN